METDTSTLSDKVVIAISSRSLFDFEEENSIFIEQGAEAYKEYQLKNINQTAAPGVAFSLVRKLLSFNTPQEQLVEIVLVSHNDPISGLRVFKSAQAHGLEVTRGVFVGGQKAYRYLSPFGVSLYLSANEENVREALAAGFPAARVYAGAFAAASNHQDQLRVAFDGDGVLFGTESQRFFDEHGLEEFNAFETQRLDTPLSDGPLKPFLFSLYRLQQKSPEKVRIALVTARNAPAHERAMRTLMSWKIEVHEAFFLGGLNKRDFLQQFEPDIFFDDHDLNCDLASEVVPTARVDHGATLTLPKTLF